MQELWRQDEAEYHGTFYDFPSVRSFPKPSQKPPPPILLGGSARNVLNRVIAWGDGWLPLGVTPEAVKQGRATLTDLAPAAGRNPEAIDVTVFGVACDPEVMQQFEAAGASRVVTRLPSAVNEDALTDLEKMAAQVLA